MDFYKRPGHQQSDPFSLIEHSIEHSSSGVVGNYGNNLLASTSYFPNLKNITIHTATLLRDMKSYVVHKNPWRRQYWRVIDYLS